MITAKRRCVFPTIDTERSRTEVLADIGFVEPALGDDHPLDD